MLHTDDSGAEAEAQRQETVTPWIWGVLGLVVIGAFVAAMLAGAPHRGGHPAAPSAPPMFKTSSGGY